MLQLARLVLVRYLVTARVRVGLTVLGIMLGVAVVFAVKLVNATVLDALHRSLGDVIGPAKLNVGAADGVEEGALERVRAVPGVDTAIPIIETSVQDVRAHTRLALVALDTLSDPAAHGAEISADDVHVADAIAFLNDVHGVLVTRAYAERAALKVGDTLLLDTPSGRQTFHIHGTVEPRGLAQVYGGDLLVMDVYAAQVALQRVGRFDRIDVIPAHEREIPSLTRALDRALDHKVPITRPEQRAAEAERLLGGFRMALSLASLVALFVGGFIIYNALAVSVTRRRQEIGTLRALGTSRAQVLGLFLAEGLLIGIAGTLLGLGFGLGLARVALSTVAATVSALYLPVKVGALSVSGDAVALACALGLGTSLLSAWLPAHRAAAVEPVSAMRDAVPSAQLIAGGLRSVGRAGLWVFMIAALVATAAHAYAQTTLALLVAGLLSLTAACTAPLLAELVGRVALRHAKRVGPSALLGALAFARNRGRHAVSTAALGMALANVVSVDALVASMKGTTDAWLNRSFRADIFVFAGSDVRAKFERPLPASLRGELSALPGVEFVQAFRMLPRSLRGQPFYLMSEDSAGYHRYNELAVVSGDLQAAWPQLESGSAVAASEAFVRSFGVRLGDSVALDTPSGPRSFRIAVVYSDYRADVGILFMPRAVYTQLFKDEQVDLYSVYLSEGASLSALRARIAQRYAEQLGVSVLGSAEYKRDLLGLVGRSMTLARATELVAVLVAGLGIINALFVGVLDRRREIGVLKALGTARYQVQRAVLTEATLIACTAALLGVLLGSALSAYMVLEALRLELGWSISLHLSGWVLLEAFAMALPIAWLAAWWPMDWATKLDVVDALQYE